MEKVIDIRELRDRLGLTQQDFAARLGVSVQSVHRWETGKAKPSRIVCKLIELLLGGGCETTL